MMCENMGLAGENITYRGTSSKPGQDVNLSSVPSEPTCMSNEEGKIKEGNPEQKEEILETV